MIDNVRYKTFSVGNAGTWCRGSVADLLMSMPYLVPHSTYETLPKLSLLNEILLTGCYDCGMSGGCEWKPFQINEQDYKALEIELLEVITRPYQVL